MGLTDHSRFLHPALYVAGKEKTGCAMANQMSALAVRSALMLLEPWWRLGCHGEAPFQRQTGAAKGTFIEKPANEGNAVGYPARRIEGGQRAIGIRCPIAPSIRNFNKAGAQCERWMAGEVGDGQHLIPERRYKQQIHL